MGKVVVVAPQIWWSEYFLLSFSLAFVLEVLVLGSKLLSCLYYHQSPRHTSQSNTVLSVIFLLGLLDPLNLETATTAAASGLEVCKQVQGVFFLMKRVQQQSVGNGALLSSFPSGLFFCISRLYLLCTQHLDVQVSSRRKIGCEFGLWHQDNSSFLH